MLNTRPSTTGTAAGDYRTIPLSRVQNFHILSLGSAQSPPVIEEQRLESKLSARVKALKEEKEDRPKGVSKEAQAIFDAFKRMYVLQPFCPPRNLVSAVCTNFCCL